MAYKVGKLSRLGSRLALVLCFMLAQLATFSLSANSSVGHVHHVMNAAQTLEHSCDKNTLLSHKAGPDSLTHASPDHLKPAAQTQEQEALLISCAQNSSKEKVGHNGGMFCCSNYCTGSVMNVAELYIQLHKPACDKHAKIAFFLFSKDTTVLLRPPIA